MLWRKVLQLSDGGVPRGTLGAGVVQYALCKNCKRGIGCGVAESAGDLVLYRSRSFSGIDLAPAFASPGLLFPTKSTKGRKVRKEVFDGLAEAFWDFGSGGVGGRQTAAWVGLGGLFGVVCVLGGAAGGAGVFLRARAGNRLDGGRGGDDGGGGLGGAFVGAGKIILAPDGAVWYFNCVRRAFSPHLRG